MMIVFLVLGLCQAHFLFPIPSAVQEGSTPLAISPDSFTITANVNSAILNGAIKRYTSLLFPFQAYQGIPRGAPVLKFLQISVGADNETLDFGVDETYFLGIPSDEASPAVLKANSVRKSPPSPPLPQIWGALRGLETFSQLVEFKSGSYVLPSSPYQIQDIPRFPWRGLLIDTARHYLELDTILQVIDTLAYNRMNTLHWHAVDAQSFPLECSSYPDLAGKGAWAPEATYSLAEIAQVIEYGLNRGVRVVLELDMPGHAASWGVGYPNLTVSCPSYLGNINNIPLDPTKEAVYTTLKAVLQEWTAADLYADSYLHVGGDEVVLGCWEEMDYIKQFMKDHNIPDTTALEAYFEGKLAAIVTGLGKHMVVWQEMFQNAPQSLPKDAIVHVWKDSATLSSVTKTGRSALLSYGWYLDRQVPDPPATFYEWEDTWKSMYVNEPDNGLTADEAKFVLGGEAAMWGEQVDSSDLVSRVWPRTCAVAERLWSPKSVVDLTDATRRLVAHRCRLRQRGVPAGPLIPDYCPMPKKK